jgi:hypothetical protein
MAYEDFVLGRGGPSAEGGIPVCACGITQLLGQAYFDGHVHDPVNLRLA